MPKFCPECGTPLQQTNAKFCPECGTGLTQETSAQKSPAKAKNASPEDEDW
jgi:uncharacterized Zn finger protein (UPF0148 family)